LLKKILVVDDSAATVGPDRSLVFYVAQECLAALDVEYFICYSFDNAEFGI